MPVRDHLPVLAVVVAGEDEYVAAVRVTVKLAPSAPSADGAASTCPPVIVIVTDAAPDPLMETRAPFCTANPPENETLPKLSRGTGPRWSLGISSIHSAEESDDAYVTEV